MFPYHPCLLKWRLIGFQCLCHDSSSSSVQFVKLFLCFFDFWFCFVFCYFFGTIFFFFILSLIFFFQFCAIIRTWKPLVPFNFPLFNLSEKWRKKRNFFYVCAFVYQRLQFQTHTHTHTHTYSTHKENNKKSLKNKIKYLQRRQGQYNPCHNFLGWRYKIPNNHSLRCHKWQYRHFHSKHSSSHSQHSHSFCFPNNNYLFQFMFITHNLDWFCNP